MTKDKEVPEFEDAARGTLNESFEDLAIEYRSRYEKVFENAIVGIYRTTPDGRILLANPALVSMLGYSSFDELRARNLEADGYDAEYPRTEFKERLARDGRVLGMESIWQRRDGTPVHIRENAWAAFDLDGSPIYYEGTVEDITGHKAAVDALRASEELHRTLLALTPDPVVMVEAGEIRFVNDAYTRTFGYTQDDIGRGLDFFTLVQERDQETVIQRYRDRMAGKYLSSAFRIDLVAKDGTIVPCEAASAGLQFDDRDLNVTIIRDVSERVRAEEEKEKLEEQLRHAQKLESLGVLAGGIAHDFNNLLTGLMGYAELAEDLLPEESPAKSYLGEIGTLSVRLSDLTNQMLAYSGRGRFCIERVDLAGLLLEMSQLFELSVPSNVTLECECQDGLPAVEADATQLRQVIMNLVANAADAFGDQPGEVFVKVTVEDADRALLASSYVDDNLDEGRYIALEVTDRGSGMSAETKARIFDPFFSTKFAGRGLGLAAVLGIVRGHKGAIIVNSKLEQGTTFVVLLPVADSPELPIPEQRPTAVAVGLVGRVLIVDDEDTVLAVASDMLLHAGYDVEVTSNGQDAIELLSATTAKIDIVLLDLTMPKMSGQETYRKLRDLRPDLPVVLMSGFTEDDAIARLGEAGLAGFLQKPFKAEALFRVLQAPFSKL